MAQGRGCRAKGAGQRAQGRGHRAKGKTIKSHLEEVRGMFNNILKFKYLCHLLKRLPAI